LREAGWPRHPGAERPENTEYALACLDWQDALRELASLNATAGGMDAAQAIGQLEQICRRRVFQPGSTPSNIQVLGHYEVTGLRFDHLWVLGLHGENWPPPARPNPFLPAALQRGADLPHASPQRELEVAKTVTRRLLATANETVFSYPGTLEGEPLLPSPLLEGLETVGEGELPLWPDRDGSDAIAHAGGLRRDALTGPGPLHAPKARGGSAILRNQALCPFRAFAVSRLGAEGLESPVDGISPLLHGSLLHRLLERFWAVTVNQENLLALDEESIRERLETLVSEVVQEDRGLNQRPQFRDVEARRLLRLALRHLALERTRDPFEVIGFEQEVIESFGDQNIRLIIDRIDRLASGGEAIIDYKTGRVDPKKWFGERPEDPQLPLYAISAAETPAAVVFAVLRDDECSYKGVVTETGQFPDLPPRPSKSNEALRRAGESMPATVKQWREVLHGLMADFLAGRAAVDPKDGRQTCDDSYCDLQPLCRIAELDQWRREGSE
jgi:probable DNA repair protein